jgi:hypothetical protein
MLEDSGSLQATTNPSETPSTEDGFLFGSTPSYLLAADSHAISAGKPSMLDPSQWGETALSAGKFGLTSGVAAVTSAANSLITVGNWFDADIEKFSTAAAIQGLDDDLGAYYKANQAGVDIVGDIVGSFIPGLGGVKLLNWGQKVMQSVEKTGRLGANFTRATGLLAPSSTALLGEATAAQVSASSVFRITEANTLKALASGFGQNALEAAAFETAVQVTMHSSPILDGQDYGDIVSNVAWGALFGGIAGGVISGARTVGEIKKGIRGEDLLSKPYTHITATASVSDPFEKILWAVNDIHSIPTPTGERAVQFSSLAAEKVSKLNNDIRGYVHEIVGGDKEVANLLADSLRGMNKEEVFGAVMHLKASARMTQVTGVEKLLNKNATSLSEEQLAAQWNMKVSHLKLWGEGAGEVTAEGPGVLALADTLGKNEMLAVRGNKVIAVNAVSGSGSKILHSFDPKVSWSALEAKSIQEAEARYIWALHSPPLKDGVTIHQFDIPLLEKAGREGTEDVYILGDGGVKHYAPTLDSQFIESVKRTVATRLKYATENKQIGTDPVAVETKLKQMLGINFEVIDEPGVIGQWVRGKVHWSKQAQAIQMDRRALTSVPLSRLVQTIKHEEGHSIFDTMLDIGMIPNELLPQIRVEAEALSRKMRPQHWQNVDKDYIAGNTQAYSYLRKDHELMADTFSYFAQHPGDLPLAPTFNSVAGHLIRPLDQSVIDSLNLQVKKLTEGEIAAVTNTHLSWLNRSDPSEKGMLALQTANEEYIARNVKSGLLTSPEQATTPAYFKPQNVKLGYDVQAMQDTNGHVLEGMTYLKQRQKLYQATIDNVFAKGVGDRLGTFTTFTDEDTIRTSRLGTGSVLTGGAGGNYGDPASKAESIGVALSELKRARVSELSEALESSRYAIKNSEPAKLEYATLYEQLRTSSENYILRTTKDENGNIIKAQAVNRKLANPGTGRIEDARIPPVIEITNMELAQYLQAHIATNDLRQVTKSDIRGAQSMATQRDLSGNIYLPPPDPKQFQHFAFVRDTSVTSTGHVSMLHAATEEQLAAMITKVRTSFGDTFEVTTKEQQAAFHKARGDYQYDLGLNENYIDTAIKRKGISNFFPRTDGDKLLDQHFEWAIRQEQGVATELVELKYSKPITELRRQGQQFTDIATSRYTGTGAAAKAEVKNPYEDIVRTMLDVSKTAEFPLWTAANRLAETSVSKLASTLGNLWAGTKSTADLVQVNDALAKAGIKSAYYDAATELLANHTAPKPVLSDFILKASGILSTLVLRADPLNALNNGLGANILLAAEANHVWKYAMKGDTDIAGKLAGLGTIRVPGTDSTVRSPGKLIAQAYSDWFSAFGAAGEVKNELKTLYQQNGWMTSISEQMKATFEHLIVKGNETPAELQTMLQKSWGAMKSLGDVAERATGNRMAEEMNRFVAARTMHLMAEPLVEAGEMSTKELVSYINTFVSRTQGNRIASQRPVMFQGPLGHSISLFQTYQLNLMQQMFRYVADGGVKDAALLLGLQGSIYGMNGLPAFNAINTHLAGNASGNTAHTDITATTFDVAGKEAGDWILYGMASNLFLHPDLKVNMYSRGDINPRNNTIIPINPADTPIYQGATKFFGSIFDTVSKIAGGGDVWRSMLQGIEHNGISRPLAGLAQSMEAAVSTTGTAYSTDAKGSIVNQNDFLSLTTLSRIAGGKPLDEAIARDAVFRINSYHAKDIAETKLLGGAMRTTMIEGRDPDLEQQDRFLEAYVKHGGKQENFNKFMIQQYKQANTSQANKIFENLRSPFAVSMQKVMGGYQLDDFNN